MPTIDELAAQISALQGLVTDLSAQVGRQVRQQATPATTPALATSEPFWDMTRCTGLTLTTGAALDWDPLFNNAGATDFQKLSPPIGRGCFDCGNLGFAFQRRLVVTWDAKAASAVKLFIGGTSVYTADTDAAIQVNMNGKMTEYAAGSGPFANVSQIISLSVKAGRNRLAISTDIYPDTLQVGAVLWDDSRGDAWVDPRTFSDYLRSTT